MSSQTSAHTPWLHTRGMPVSCLGFGCFADAGLQLLLMSHGKGRAVLLFFFLVLIVLKHRVGLLSWSVNAGGVERLPGFFLCLV